LAGSQSNGQGYCLRVDRARPWQWAPACPALMNIDAHRFEDTYLCFLDALSEAVDPWKILTVSIVLSALAFDGDGVSIKLHNLIVLHHTPSPKMSIRESLSTVCRLLNDLHCLRIPVHDLPFFHAEVRQ